MVGNDPLVLVDTVLVGNGLIIVKTGQWIIHLSSYTIQSAHTIMVHPRVLATEDGLFLSCFGCAESPSITRNGCNQGSWVDCYSIRLSGLPMIIMMVNHYLTLVIVFNHHKLPLPWLSIPLSTCQWNQYQMDVQPSDTLLMRHLWRANDESITNWMWVYNVSKY